jgi:hypothetical protein
MRILTDRWTFTPSLLWWGMMRGPPKLILRRRQESVSEFNLAEKIARTLEYASNCRPLSGSVVC